MATRIWSSSGSTDMNLSTNYSGSGALLTSDDLVFNNTSVIDAIATANLDVGSVTIANTYTGIWALTGFSLIVENSTGFSDAGITGAHNYGNAITLNGASAPFTVSGSSVITATSCTLTITNNVTVTSAGNPFSAFVINASGKTVTLADDLFVNTYTLTAGSLAKANFYMYVFSAGTTNIWTAASAGNWNVAGNWSLGHSPTPSEDAVFTSASVSNLTINVSPTVANIGFSAAYTGTVTWAGQTITTNGAFSDYGSGAKNYGNGINLNGTNANMSVGARVGTVTGTSCNLISNGSGNAFWDTKGVTLKSLFVSAGVSFTIATGTPITVFSNVTNPLNVGDNATLTVNKAVRFVLTASSTFYSLGSNYTITSALANSITFGVGASGITAQLPAITTGGGLVVQVIDHANFSNWSVQWTGPMTCGGALSVITVPSMGSTSLFDFNNQNITCTTFTIGRAVASTNTMTVNFGSGTFNISAFNGTTRPNGCYMNFQSSTWNCSSSWIQVAANIVDPGTSTVNFIFITTTTLVSAGQPFFNLTAASVTFNVNDQIIIANGGTFTNNATTCNINPTASLTVLSFLGTHTFNGTGPFSIGGATASLTITLSALTYTGSGAWTINPAATSTTVFSGATSLSSNLTLTGGAVTFSSSLTFTGSNTFTIGTGIGTFLGTSCDLTFNGTGAVFADNKSVTLRTLTIGTGDSLTITGPSNSVFESSTTPLVLGNNASLVFSTTIFLYLTTANPFFSLGSGYSISGTGGFYFYVNANNITCTVPAYTHTGSGQHRFSAITGRTGWTIQLTGPFNCNTGLLAAIISSTNSSGTIDFNDQNVTCGVFQPGCSTTLGTITIYYGSGTFNVTVYGGTSYAQGSGNIYFESSQWSCAGNWSNGPTHTITHLLDQVTIKGTSTIISNGKAFNYVTINAPGNTVTLSDNFVAHGYNRIAGTLNQNGKKFTVQGDYQNVIDCD